MPKKLLRDLGTRVALTVANFDRVHRTPEEHAAKKRLLKRFKKHVKTKA